MSYRMDMGMKLRHPDGGRSGQLDSPTLMGRLVPGDKGGMQGGKALERCTCPKTPRKPHLGTFQAQALGVQTQVDARYHPLLRVWVRPVTCRTNRKDDWDASPMTVLEHRCMRHHLAGLP